MAKFCTHCGNEVNEKAVICVKCGCAIPNGQSFTNWNNADNSQYSGRSQHTYHSYFEMNQENVIKTISERIYINGIIWLVIACIQILLGILGLWYTLIIGILNLISAIYDIKYSKLFLLKPIGIVNKVRPLVGSIITLIYNVFMGGIIGVAGSVYYLVAVRGYVLENERIFCEIENQYIANNL